MSDTWHLSEKGFFADLSEKSQSAFFSVAVRKLVKKGEFVFNEGDTGQHCFYLQSGSVRIFHFTDLGKEPIIFIRKAGEIFGIAEIINSNQRKCNAQAMTTCELYIVEKAAFEKLLEDHYEIARKVLGILGRRLRYLGEQMENLMFCDVRTRVLKLMLYFVHHGFERTNPEKPITVPLNVTQSQIASMTGSCQQTVSETLRDLQDLQIIKIEKRSLTVINPIELMDMVYNG